MKVFGTTSDCYLIEVLLVAQNHALISVAVSLREVQLLYLYAQRQKNSKKKKKNPMGRSAIVPCEGKLILFWWRELSAVFCLIRDMRTFCTLLLIC
jgi:hypothetical protein